ncbi:hypothetical protein SAY87_003294 [Trapa incisa]|uniref:non-specific serine/threonine protein kinase n=1 Tax=Trapa incisa TaxID=236973 RepID=A0AAN7QJ06_9MYRT|nr:hypothetical protein SAY87_003294 [Trapa incisa]
MLYHKQTMTQDPPFRFLPLSCTSCLFLLFVFFYGVESSFPSYCSSDVACNGVRISYPFWKIDHGSDISCGYQGFGLSCSSSNDTYPILTLPNDSYYVKDINYSTGSLTLVDIDVVEQSCPRAKHNFSINSLPLDYHSDDVNLTFYFNCSITSTGYDTLPVDPIDCLVNSPGKTSYVVLEGTPAEQYNWAAGACDEVVVATVKKTEVSETDLISKFSEAMKTGFLLLYDTTKDCGACEFTHGRCGLDNRTGQFLCFCDNGSIHANGSNTYCTTDLSKIDIES